MASQIELLSRIAAGDGHGENSSYFDGWKAYDADPFDLHHNPGGVIQMSLAENQLPLDLIEEWSLNHPEVSICTPQGASQFKRIANFQDYHGLPEFRQAMAKFMGQVRGGKATFDPDRVVTCGGATGHTRLLPCRPRGRLPHAHAVLPRVRSQAAADRVPQLQRLQAHHGGARGGVGLRAARGHERRIKGILITNPSNRLGTTMDRGILLLLGAGARSVYSRQI